MNSSVSEIHAADRPGVLAITGGGSQAIADLLAVPGASRTVLEALVPYSARALADLLHAAPEHACSPRTARSMAMASFWRAWQWTAPADDDPQFEETAADCLERIWGLGCTASLRSDREKKGEHRCHIAVQRAHHTDTVTVVLEKGARSRAEEERLVADLILHVLARALGFAAVEPPLRAGDVLTADTATAAPDWSDVVLGRVDAVAWVGSGDIMHAGEASETRAGAEPNAPADLIAEDSAAEGAEADNAGHSSGLIFPGAFNPLHHGHLAMAQLAAQRLGRPVEYELSVENVDKPPLDYVELGERLGRFPPAAMVWLTRAPTFVDKARIFPGATFVVGVDTLARIAAARYYGTEQQRDEALAELARLDVHFLVFPRLLGSQFETLDSLKLPAELRARCTGVSAEEFREDISSTALRSDAELVS